ncbi:hypothetical protein EPN18_00760 [bacterium]|nr:MAG: hypothetical protein EPN18_00760 [bacterium]
MRDKKSLWLLFFSLIALLPGAAYGLERDPYMRRTLTGRVYLDYEKVETRQGTYTDKFDKFQQTYNLDTKGFLYARNALIYSLSGSFINTDSTQNSVKTGTKNTQYNFETTALPLSAIPLTFFTNHDENRATTTNGGSTSDAYGIDWFARIRSLPATKVHAEKRDRVSDQRETIDTIYKLSMKKKIGPTNNDLLYDTITTDNTNAGTRNSQTTVNFTNDTVISKSTEVHAGYTENVNVAENGQKSTLNGVSINLASTPSSDFSQKHRYTFYGNSTSISNQEGHNYDGTMSYAFSPVTSASASALYQKNTTDSSSSQFESENGNVSGSFATAVTRTIGFSQALSYAENKANIVAGTNQGNMTSRKTTTSNTSLTYRRKFKLALLTGNYGIHYTQDQTSDANSRGGTGMGQNARVGLADINFNRHVGFNANSAYSKTDTVIGGNIHETTYSYGGNAFNKTFKQYFGATASYNYLLIRSWLNTLNKETENIDYHVDTSYIKNTKVGFAMHEENSNSITTGSTSTSTKDFTLNHKRPLFGGNLGADFSYNIVDNVYRGGTSGTTITTVKLNYSRMILKGNFGVDALYTAHDYVYNTGGYGTTDKRYTARYSKALFRRVLWRTAGERTETERDDALIFSKKTSIENALVYQLRAWGFSAEHRYAVTSNESHVDLTETRIFFRVERSFGMFL